MEEVIEPEGKSTPHPFVREEKEEMERKLLQDQKVYCLLPSSLWLAVDGCCGRIITSSHLQLPVGPNIWEL